MFHALISRSLARPIFAFFALLSAATVAVFAQTPSAADGFDPNVDGNVYVLATQPDGKILVAGQFSSFRPNGADVGTTRNNLARLNPDGSLDATFNPNVNGPVRAIYLQPDGRIVIGGDFTAVQPNGAATATARGRIARLNPDGSLDSTFSFTVTNVFNGITLQAQVLALAVQSDGALVVGGTFTNVQAGTAAALTRHDIFRIAANGSLDATYDPNPNGTVLALAPHVDGKMLVGGGFTTFQENGKPAATTRNRIARLNRDGTVDSQFDPNANNGVTSFAVQRDGKIVLGGYFTTLQPLGNDTAANRSHLARLNVDGSLDSEFFPNAAGDVYSLTLEPDGGLIIGGTFSSVWARGGASESRFYAARFTPDGSVDADFNPNVNAEVDAATFQSDGKIVLGGFFTRSGPAGVTTSVIRNRIARVNPNGSLDVGLALDPGGRPLVSITQADGKIVLGGTFTNVAGQTHNFLARLNTDGTIDSSYKPSLDGRVLAMAYDAASNKVLIGGAFTTISTPTTGTDTRNHFARLNADGSPDSEFNPNVDGQVTAIALQSDGQILIGGSFSFVQPIGAPTQTARTNLARITATGQLDANFNPTPDNTVTSILVQSDGKILVGGEFSSFLPNGATVAVGRSDLARLNADGTVDTAFATHFNSRVNALALQGDGKIVVVGLFDQVALQTDTTSTVRDRIARLTSTGAIDTTFDPNANGAILAVAVQGDGKILIGGPFTTLQPNGATTWTLRKYFARLNADGTVDPTFDLDLNEQNGNRVDSIRVLADGRILVGGTFTSVQPLGTGVRTPRQNFARINANGSLDTGFNIAAGGSTGGQINALALQADGRIVAAGSFADFGGAKTSNIARFTAEGSPDPSFGAVLSADGPINAVAIRPNGNPVPTPVAGFAWLNRDGTLRSGFKGVEADGVTPARLSGEVHSFAIQSDGKVILGGAFSNLSNSTHGNLVRFSANGTLDSAFDPNPDGSVEGIALQSDGRILIVGSFVSIGGTARNHIARLNADGTLDTSYDPNASGEIRALALQSDGKAVIGGLFSTLTPNGATTATARAFIARLNTDGTVDANYFPTTNSSVDSLTIQGDGKVIAGGEFTSVQPNGATTTTTRNYIARFNTDGSLDQNFDPNANSFVSSVVAQPNGSILLGGQFTTLQPNGATTGTTRYYLARVNSDGAVDSGFYPYANNVVSRIALQGDGAILLGGQFTTIQPNGTTTGGIARNHLARLNADGSLDPAFNPEVNGSITGIFADPDGTVLIGGAFTGVQPNGVIVAGGAFNTIGSTPARNLAIVNDDGSINGAFQPKPNGAVNAILTYPDGRFIAGGAFTTLTPSGSTTAVPRNRLARFKADGTLDTTFNPGADNTVTALALQADGKLIVGGSFSNIAGQPRVGLARLNADGTLDPSFSAQLGSTLGIYAIAVQPDGRIVVAHFEFNTGPHSAVTRLNADGSRDGTFSRFVTVDGNPPFLTINALSLQTDGRIIVAGGFTSNSSKQLVRLNADGTVDSSFAPAPNGAVSALALQFDGRLVVGGNFTQIGGQTRYGLARLGNTGASAQSLGVTPDRTTAIWTRGGTSGELAGVTFETSTDGRTWSTPVTGTRVGTTSNWQISGLQLPGSGLFYVRARGIAPSSDGVSSGLYEIVREFSYTSPVTVTSTPALTDASGFTIDPTSGVIAALPPAAAGVYLGVNGASPEIVGVASNIKVLGAGAEVRANITHPNKNVYDQVLLEGNAATITADAGQITRTSFTDLNGDIVQVEFSGAGSLSIVLDAPSGPAPATNYNQPDVAYMQGNAALIITGADETTNISVFSVGTITAVDQSLFRGDVHYDGIADIAYLAISTTDGKFGSVRTGNASYFSTHGLTGLYAPGVQFTGPVNIGDISGYDSAVAMLVVGSASDVNITGGDLWQSNRQPLAVGGISQLKFVDGMTSSGVTLRAQANRAQLEDGSADVTNKIVVNPAQ
ncbi:MAG TPA: hypothetical protein VHD62_05565 [Opitutaceae bacterium]|nr:hypothetical protein [Opitutaceae bacterium]